MRVALLATLSTFALVACGPSAESGDSSEQQTAAAETNDYGYETYSDDNLADTMASNDDRYMDESGSDAGSEDATPTDLPDSEERPIMQAQVVLDRAGFGPGVIDGKMGMSTENALLGFQEANDLETSGKLDDATKEALKDWERIPATRVVTIPTSWSDATYSDIPDDTAAKAKNGKARLSFAR